MSATPFQRMLRQAARRDLYAVAVRRVGVWLAWACGAALLVLALDRWFGMGVPRTAYAIIVALGGLGGIIHALLNRRDQLEIAVQLDRELRLKDRVGSALAMEKRTDPFTDEGFGELLKRDAASLAGRVDVAAATP